jgi:transposase InsO family protein
MNQEITNYIEQCEICNTFASQQQKEPLIVHDVPQRPWEKIGSDIFTVDQKDYLCTVDYYSGYFEVDKLDRKTAKPIITRLKRHFSTHGIPSQLYSDNGPPFDSHEFREFSRQYEFTIITSSPNYPQSNGRVENAIKTAKRLMKKAKEAGTDFYIALLDWRNTPTEGLESSPVQRLFGRRTRTLMPTASALLMPKVPHDVRDKLLQRKERQTKYYDRNVKELPPLKQGDRVRISPKPSDRTGKWIKAEVEDQVDIRPYNVRTEDGRVYRRNRRHLRKSQPVQLSPQPLVEMPTEYPTTVQPSQALSSQQDATPPQISPPPIQPPPPASSNTTHKFQETSARTTRSGLQVKLPSYLKDYELDKKK